MRVALRQQWHAQLEVRYLRQLPAHERGMTLSQSNFVRRASLHEAGTDVHVLVLAMRGKRLSNDSYALGYDCG